MPTKEKRYAISISTSAGEALRRLQAHLEREVGFVPSMSQVVEYLVSKHIATDKLTGGHNV